MSATAIPQAAGITGALSEVGLSSAEVHAWFHQPRRELLGLTPSIALTFAGVLPGAVFPSAQRVLELARRDAAALPPLPAAWEGSD